MTAWARSREAHITAGPAALAHIQSAPALNPTFRAHLRLVTIDDAPFIYSLRTDSKLNRHLRPPPPDVESQRAWTRRYKERETTTEEFYFIIRCNGHDMGTVRMHDFRQMGNLSSFNWGSWVVKEPRPPGLVPFSVIMIYELGLEVLGFDQGRFEVGPDNPSLGIHPRMGAKREGERDGLVGFSMSPDALRTLKGRSQRLIARFRETASGSGNG